MKISRLLLLVLAFVILLSFLNSYSPLADKKKIGWYYRDSLVREIPDYKKAVDSVEGYCFPLRLQRIQLKSDYERKKTDFHSSDTTKMSPIILALLKRNLEESRIHLNEFTGQAMLDSIYLRQRLMQGIYTKMDSAAAAVTRKEKLHAVIDRNDLSLYSKWEKEDAKFREVTEEMRKELGVLPK